MATTANTTRYTNLDIIVQQGDDLDATNGTFPIVDSNGANVNLTYYDSGTLIVKKRNYSSSTELTFDTADSSLTLQDGSFILAQTSTNMELSRGAYSYEMVCKKSAVEVTICRGQFIVK
jgi:hypothetical protein